MFETAAGRDVEQADAEAAAVISFEIGEARWSVGGAGLRVSLQGHEGGGGEQAARQKSTA